MRMGTKSRRSNHLSVLPPNILLISSETEYHLQYVAQATDTGSKPPFAKTPSELHCWVGCVVGGPACRNYCWELEAAVASQSEPAVVAGVQLLYFSPSFLHSPLPYLETGGGSLAAFAQYRDLRKDFT